MSTKTQKNFKKQMKEIQKNASIENNEKYYSYIEKDYIDSYYKKRFKNKSVGISLFAVIIIVISGLFIALNMDKKKLIAEDQIIVNKSNSVIYNKKINGFVSYMNSVNSINKEVNFRKSIYGSFQTWVLYLENLLDNYNNDNVIKANKAAEDININSINERNLLLECFKKNKIKYEVGNNGQITYWYSN